MNSTYVLTQCGGWGRQTEKRTHRYRDRRENSLMFHFMETLNLLDEFSILRAHLTLMGFAGDSDGRESAFKGKDLGSILGSVRFPGGGNGKPLQYSCLRNPMDRGFWWAIDHGVPKSQNPFQNIVPCCLGSNMNLKNTHSVHDTTWQKAVLGGNAEKEEFWLSGPSGSLWAFLSRLRVNSQ